MSLFDGQPSKTGPTMLILIVKTEESNLTIKVQKFGVWSGPSFYNLGGLRLKWRSRRCPPCPTEERCVGH